MSTRVLVVAGHDPSCRGARGGAGVDADREACAHFGAAAECVVTAWTEQDGGHVRALNPVPPEEWLEEARYALAVPIGALKSGLLPGAAAVRALARLIDELPRAPRVPVVVDPVLAASGGEEFLDRAGRDALLEELVPKGVILTPNLPEAALLAGVALAELQESRAARLAAARALLERGAAAVLLKGGHASDDPTLDLVLARDAEPHWLPHPRVAGARLHGSGCRFASAVAAQLAQGVPLEEAAQRAGVWLATLLSAAR